MPKRTRQKNNAINYRADMDDLFIETIEEDHQYHLTSC